MKKIKHIKIEHLIIFLYFSLYFIVGISLLVKQPFGNPPDEHTRYLIPAYIAEHGVLPNGYDEEIRIPGYGLSYAFYPILPYIIQGFMMRLTQCFTTDFLASLYTARAVNLFFGFINAVFVLILAKKWFSDKRLQYLFAFLVTFLPQSIFLHTYINTDSCSMMSIAIMLYGLTRGLSEQFSIPSCIWLSLGIILCALSYYNAYGYILSCILLFIAYYMSNKNSRLKLDWKPFLTKGCFISALVLLGISWWFIRSYILYDGDILGLDSMAKCSYLYGLPEFQPDKRVTYQRQGYSLMGMLFQSDFVSLSSLSFVGIYGPMTITTALWIYRFYKILFPVGILCCAFIHRRKKPFPDMIYQERPCFRIFYHCNLIFCIFMPCILSIIYSYSMDRQPQGRYLLPMLIPFCFYCIRGIQKAWIVLADFIQTKKPIKTLVLHHVFTGLCILLCSIIVCCLLVTVYGYAFPYYEAHPIA